MDADSYPLYNTKTRKKELLDDDQITPAILGGTHSFPEGARVEVFDPDGRRASIGAGELRSAIKEGFRVIGPRELAIDQYLKDNDNLSGAAKVFFGQALDEFALGVPELIADYSEDPFTAAKREAIKKQNELSNALGGAVGFIGSTLLGPAKALSLGSKGLTKLGGRAIAARVAKGAALEGAESVAEKAAGGFLSRLGGHTVDGIAEGALLSSPHAITESAFGDHEAAAESMLYGTLAGGLFGAGTGITKELIDAGAKGASRFYSWAEGKPLTGPEVAKKVGRTVTGVPEEHIAHLADEENLSRMIERNPDGKGYTLKVPERDQIRDEAENVLKTVQDNHDKAQQSYTQLLSDTTVAFRREMDDIAKGSAPEPVIAQIGDYLERMKASAGEVRSHYDETLKSIQDIVMSAADPKTINKVPFMIPRQTVTKMLNTLEEGLGSESALLGKTPGLTADPNKLAAIKKLEGVRQTIESYFDLVSEQYGTDVKGMDLLFARNIVRDLDALADYGVAAGQFDSAVSKTIKGAQHELRESIRGKLQDLQKKDFHQRLDPISAETVKQLAGQAETLWDTQIRKARVLSEAGQFFQSPIRTANALNTLSGKTFRGSEINRVLDAVEKETGESVRPMLEDWLHRKDLLRESKLGGDRVEYVRSVLMPEQHAVLEKAKQRALAAEAEVKDVKGWDARRVESAVNRIDYKNKSINDERGLQRISELRDKYLKTPDNPDFKSRNFAQEAKDRAIWDSFDQARVTGSRKAVMGASAGTALGALFGPLGAAIGGALGAGGGGIIDFYGGKMLRDFIVNGNNYRGLLFVEAQMKKAAKQLDTIGSAVDSFSQRKGEGVKRIARMGGVQSVLGIKGDFKDRREHWEKIEGKVTELASNPELLMRSASDISGGLSRNGASSIGQKLNQKIMKSVKYIFDEMPKPPRAPTPFSPKSQWKPTDYELKMFDDKLEVLANPFTVIDRLKDRTLSSGHVDSLKANYPRIYDEIKSRTAGAMLEKKTTVDRSDRVKLSILFDASFDSGLSDAGILASQAVYQKEQQGPESQGAQPQQGGQSMQVNIAGQYAGSRVGRTIRDMQSS